MFWTLAGPHFAFARNIAIHDSGSAYDNRHGEGHFVGKVIPFGAGLFFNPIPSLAKGKEKPKFEEPEVPGIFLGYALNPGGKWTGRYMVAALKEFVGMDLRVGREVRVQEVPEVDWSPESFTFPIKPMYDSADYTLEGFSVPYEVDPSYVKAQSIAVFDFKPKEKEPVGEPVAAPEDGPAGGEAADGDVPPA